MMRKMLLAAVVLSAAGLLGCVERQMTLVTEPEGAKAYYNGTYVGETPVTFHFTYYQAPGLKFEKDGYRTLCDVPDVKAPWYETFPFDFLAETSPFTFYDKRTFSYKLDPSVKADVGELVKRAEELRNEVVPQR